MCDSILNCSYFYNSIKFHVNKIKRSNFLQKIKIVPIYGQIKQTPLFILFINIYYICPRHLLSHTVIKGLYTVD